MGAGELVTTGAQIQLLDSVQLELRQLPLKQISPDWQLALLPQVPLQLLGVELGARVGVAVTVGVGEAVTVAVGVGVDVIVGVGVGVGVGVDKLKAIEQLGVGVMIAVPS